MRVDSGIEKVVVFIGRVVRGEFVPYGTGFLVATIVEDETFQTIVTARHVLDWIQGTDDIFLRVNTHDGNFRLEETKRSNWICHRDKRIDLAVLPIHLSAGLFDILHIDLEQISLTDEVLKEHDIGIGDEIVMCGLFLSRPGEARNIPVIRAGVLSAMPSEEIKTEYGFHHAYLVEARSTGGLSGSPVFVQTGLWRSYPGVQGNVIPKMTTGGLRQYFIGMILGHNTLETRQDSLEIVRTIDVPEEGAEKERHAKIIPHNSGIGIVLPVSYIAETVLAPALQAQRRKAIGDKRKRQGYTSDSAGSAGRAPSTKADNPSHKEDFNRLLDAAVKGPKSGPRTSE